ncbi:MAG: hypothetical protein ACTSVZ_00180 [Promethearchaeota archaeon]
MYEKWAGSCSIAFDKIVSEKKIEYLGYFHCQGSASPGIENFIHQQIVTDEKDWPAFLQDMRTRPNQSDLHKGKIFAKEIINNFH